MITQYTIFYLGALTIMLGLCGCSKYAKKRSISTQSLLEVSEKNYSDAILIAHNGENILSWYKNGLPEKIQTMSITKTIMALIMGKLIDDGLLLTLDTPLVNFIPSWQNTPKQYLTIRHILNQTSGLNDYEPSLLFSAKDLNTLAEKTPLLTEPGSKYNYTNISYNLLNFVVNALTKQSIKAYADKSLFSPLGITDYAWEVDQAGNYLCFAGIVMYPADLLKLGEFLRNKGRFNNIQIISASFIRTMTTEPSQPYNPNYGLSCYLIYKSPTGEIGYKQKGSTLVGFHALGYLGQELIVFPKKKLVGVRMHIRNQEDIDHEANALRAGSQKDLLNPLRNPVFFWKLQEILYNFVK